MCYILWLNMKQNKRVPCWLVSHWLYFSFSDWNRWPYTKTFLDNFLAHWRMLVIRWFTPWCTNSMSCSNHLITVTSLQPESHSPDFEITSLSTPHWGLALFSWVPSWGKKSHFSYAEINEFTWRHTCPTAQPITLIRLNQNQPMKQKRYYS